MGDHKQLPAVVRQSEEESAVSSEALRGIGLDNCRNSLFERLLRTERAAGRREFTGVLRRHGRMHPDVADFPCREFYAEERLVPVPLAHQKETALGYAAAAAPDGLGRMLAEHRMIFIPSRLCRRPDVSDKVNTCEAAIVAGLLRRIRLMTAERFDARKTVGVIVPYRNQIAVIRKEIEKTGMAELEEVSVDTVERYQGSQRDVIIYSFTVQSRWQLEPPYGQLREGRRPRDRPQAERGDDACAPPDDNDRQRGDAFDQPGIPPHDRICQGERRHGGCLLNLFIYSLYGKRKS